MNSTAVKDAARHDVGDNIHVNTARRQRVEAGLNDAAGDGAAVDDTSGWTGCERAAGGAGVEDSAVTLNAFADRRTKT